MSPRKKVDPQAAAAVEALIKEHPALPVIAMALAGHLLMQPSKPGPDVPGLRERRNGAWRGKGSFGKAPFGTQVTHRR